MMKETRCPECFSIVDESNLIQCAHCGDECCDNCVDDHETDCDSNLENHEED